MEFFRRLVASVVAGAVLGLVVWVFGGPIPGLTVGVVLGGVLLIVTWEPIWSRVPLRRVRLVLAPVGTPRADEGSGFRSHWLRSELEQISASGIWEPEPHLHLHVLVENLSPWPVRVLGLGGRLAIGSTSCNQVPELEPAPTLIQPGQAERCQIRQALSAALAQELAMGASELNLYSSNARVPVSLVNLQWNGEYEEKPGASKPLSGVSLSQDRVYMVGPVREGDSAKELLRSDPLFYSVEWYTPQFVPRRSP